MSSHFLVLFFLYLWLRGYQAVGRAVMWLDAAIFLADAECAKPLAKWGCYAQVNAAGHRIHESCSCFGWRDRNRQSCDNFTVLPCGWGGKPRNLMYMGSILRTLFRNHCFLQSFCPRRLAFGGRFCSSSRHVWTNRSNNAERSWSMIHFS